MQFNFFNNNSGDSRKKNLKLLILAIMIIAIFFLYALKLFSMQIIGGEQYRNQSVRISRQVKSIPAQRGEIYDRNFTMPLVINVDSFAVDLIPGEIPNGYYDTVAMKLSEYLGITKSSIDKKVPASLRRSFSTIEIKTNVTMEDISNIAENITDLPGVSWRSKPIRKYVETGSMSHVLGYVGDITKEEINVMYNKGYKQNSIIGKTGIEKQYDSLLQGVEGRESRTVDVRGRVLNTTPVIEPPQMGKNLVLTIDSKAQKLAEKSLGERVGSVVVLKPATGEILAMVSYPYFDGNIFSSEDAGSEYTRLANSKNNPLLNRAVNAVYPPASTFKTIMATAMLSENAFPSEKKIECTGKLQYADRVFNCHVKTPGHGWLDLRSALAESCDVYFWVIGRDYLGVDRISSYAKEFGFGQSLQIDLPAHSEGLVPTAQWKERRFHEPWFGGDTMNMSIGQGYTKVTPMHIADMMAMVCNSGTIYKPHLLKEVRDPATNEIIQEIQPEVLLKSTVDKRVWQEVQRDLRYVITNGTPAYPMGNRQFQIAGKTGTAEVDGYEKNHWHSWMVAYAPFNAPPEEQIVVATIVEAVNDWEWWAPYCTNIVIQGVLGDQTFDEAVDTLGFRYIFNMKQQQSGRRE